MSIDVGEIVRSLFSEEAAFTVAVIVLISGAICSYLVWRFIHSLFENTGINNAVEGTAFERSVSRFGTTTSGIIATLMAIFVYIVTIIVAFNVARLLDFEVFWTQVTRNLPRLFIALLAIIVGLIAGDKAKLTINDRLRSVKLPEATILGDLAKYSIFYIAALIALAQVGVATTALLVLLGAYAFGLVFLCGIAFKDFLSAGAAGVYLLLTEPYTIGDEVRIGDKRGIVQEVDMFVTHIEAEEEEHIIPNQMAFRKGIIRIRN